MLIKDCIYYIAILLSLCAIPILLCSIKNKNRNICKGIISINIIYIIYLFIDLAIVPSILSIEIGFEILLLYLLALVSSVLYIISIILCLTKMRKTQIYEKSNKTIVAVIVLLVLPILFFSLTFFREKFLINNSDLILVYYSGGNGGFGDGETFAYAISENYCEQFSLGIDFHGYSIEKFLPKTATEIKNIEDMRDYEITLNNDNILIYKGKKSIHKKQYKSNYFNIEFERGFYINHN